MLCCNADEAPAEPDIADRKIEYLHIDLGDQTQQLVAPATGNGFVTAKFNNAYDIVRAGVNWRF